MRNMKKSILLLTILVFSFVTMLGAVSDYNRSQAERYEKEAVYYQRKADNFMRDADDYKRKALNYLNDASYYTRGGNTTMSLQSTSSSEYSIKNYESKILNSQNAEKTAEMYRKKAENLRR